MKKTKVKKKPSLEDKKQQEKPSDAGSRPYDFGGIPEMDFKKKLGCG